VRALVYLSPVFCLLALAFSAKLIRRRIASEREGLSFLLLGPAFNVGFLARAEATTAIWAQRVMGAKSSLTATDAANRRRPFMPGRRRW
jgi:hypothetical protein